MENPEILSQATSIARNAQASAKRADLEENLYELEQSPVPVLRSLARAYRMLQNPFH